MNDKKIEQAFEEWVNSDMGDTALSTGEPVWIWLAGVQWEQNRVKPSYVTPLVEANTLLNKKLEKLQAELDWHKKELARLDHELVDKCDNINRLQADLKSVNFSYWKKCEEVNRLQQAVSEAREIFKDELVYCFPESNHWHGEIKKWLEKYGDNNDR